MADRFGKFLATVVSGLAGALAPGSAFNAGRRVNREVILLDDGGATATGTTIFAGRFRVGDLPHKFELASNIALTGVSFAIGTKAAPTKYSAAVAGPAAGATVVIPNTTVDEALTAAEDIYLTTSVGALPTTAAAKLIITSVYSHK